MFSLKSLKGMFFQSLDNGSPMAPIPKSRIFTLGPAVELQARAGISNFLAKANSGRASTIVYFGGSITEQDGWRVQSAEWLDAQFPKVQLRHINAAIGGTGSLLGAFRLRDDVIAHSPDLVFIEFAVNDSGAPTENIACAIEGIVRQIKFELPTCDICFIYTVTDKDIEALHQGLMKESESVMDAIAEHYGLPSIHFGVSVAAIVQSGQLRMKEGEEIILPVSGASLNLEGASSNDGVDVFSPDGIHPYVETGHRIYSAAFTRAFRQLADAAGQRMTVMPTALMLRNWEAARSVAITKDFLSGTSQVVDDISFASLRARMPRIIRLSGGASINFRFRGSKIAIGDLIGPDCGTLEISVNGKVVRYKNRFDAYANYSRISILDIPIEQSNEIQEISIKVLRRPPEKWRLLLPQSRMDFFKHPLKYWGVNWYVGNIFLAGELL